MLIFVKVAAAENKSVLPFYFRKIFRFYATVGFFKLLFS